MMPTIDDFMGKLDQTQTVIVTINFIMDGITSLRNPAFSKNNLRLSRYFYYENPSLYKFEEDEQLVLFDIAEDYLKIKVWSMTFRTDILSVQICIQTVCKGYQQTTKVAFSRQRVKLGYSVFCILIIVHPHIRMQLKFQE